MDGGPTAHRRQMDTAMFAAVPSSRPRTPTFQKKNGEEELLIRRKKYSGGGEAGGAGQTGSRMFHRGSIPAVLMVLMVCYFK